MKANVILAPKPSSVGLARRFVAGALAKCEDSYDEDTIVLLASELVTNAVCHAQTQIVLTLHCDGPVVTVEVHDDSDRRPLDREVEPTSVGGRGVHLVATAADRWGVRSVPGDGKDVWFTLGSSAGSS